MATHRYDPYLWVHLAGIATVPLWLAICMLGLAVGSPQWPGLELALLGVLGVSPALLMQLGRPFYIFSLLALTLKPTALSDDQRRLLSLFQQWWVRGLAVVSPVLLVWLLWEIYPRAVVASDITPFAPWGRVGGLAVAASSFAMANLFLQVPISVLAVMATTDKRFKRTVPYPLDRIQTSFTQAGIPLNRLLPEVLPPDAAGTAMPEAAVEDAIGQTPDLAEVEATELEHGQLDAAVATEAISGLAAIYATQEQREASPTPPTSAAIEVNEALDQPLPSHLGESDDTNNNHDAAPLTTPEDEADIDNNSEGSDSQSAEELSPELDLETVAESSPSFQESTYPTACADGPANPEEERVTVENSAETPEIGVQPSEAMAEPSTAEPQVDTDWDQDHGDWDQASRDWDQDKVWDTSADAVKERTVDVAVVRITDPS